MVSHPSTSRTWHARYCTAVRRIIYLDMYLFIQSAAAAAAAALYRCCWCSSCLLLFVIVCRMAKNCYWFVESDSIQCFLSFIQTRFIFNVFAPWQHCRIYGLDLPTSSVITGMGGAKAGVSPPRRSPACKHYNKLSMLCMLTK